MSPETAAPSAKRWRFQFSLRTLMTFVLIYGALWFATIKLGGAALAQSYSSQFSNDRVRLGVNDSVALLVVSTGNFQDNAIGKKWVETDSYYGDTKLQGRVFSPLPFVLLWNWDISSLKHGEHQPIKQFDVTYLWIPGSEIKVEKVPELSGFQKFNPDSDWAFPD